MPDKNSPSQKMQPPDLDINTGINHSPHVVILGAGASLACCPDGDQYGRKLPLMKDFVETVGIKEIIRSCGQNPSGNFEAIYSAIHRTKKSSELDALHESVRSYFDQIELPEAPTLYDYLLLSLREKDVIISFNWDPLLPQAYRRWRKLGNVLPRLVFLHGNVDIGVNFEKKSYGFLSDSSGPNPKLIPSKLLYPVERKDYNSDPFIAEQWSLATSLLARAYYVTVFGYSAPVTDVEARSLLLNAWQNNPTRRLAQFSIIDIQETKKVEKSWSDFIVKTHGGASNDIRRSILFRHPRRTCEAFAFATLQQTPWHENPFQDYESLSELEDWIMPLINEETSGRLADQKISDL